MDGPFGLLQKYQLIFSTGEFKDQKQKTDSVWWNPSFVYFFDYYQYALIRFHWQLAGSFLMTKQYIDSGFCIGFLFAINSKS
jgi:hypothetical protein